MLNTVVQNLISVWTYIISNWLIPHTQKKNKTLNFAFQKVTKEYAFELDDVPAESDYLEVRYAVSLHYMYFLYGLPLLSQMW